MPVMTARTHKRNTDILNAYELLYKSRILKLDAIITQVADQFYLQEDTIRKIVIIEKKHKKTNKLAL